MKSIPDPDTTPDEKMEKFERYLGQSLLCSKKMLDNALKYEKEHRDPAKPRRGPKPLGRASRATKP